MTIAENVPVDQLSGVITSSYNSSITSNIRTCSSVILTTNTRAVRLRVLQTELTIDNQRLTSGEAIITSNPVIVYTGQQYIRFRIYFSG